MAKALEIPDFANEDEEAKWWYDNRALVSEQFEQTAKDGMLRHGTLAKRYGLTPTTTIRLDPADIALAREQAEARGMRYQTYLKMIIHQALRSAGNASTAPLA
jgi:predicted DNA binding CopG/RHH family protein